MSVKQTRYKKYERDSPVLETYADKYIKDAKDDGSFQHERNFRTTQGRGQNRNRSRYIADSGHDEIDFEIAKIQRAEKSRITARGYDRSGRDQKFSRNAYDYKNDDYAGGGRGRPLSRTSTKNDPKEPRVKHTISETATDVDSVFVSSSNRSAMPSTSMDSKRSGALTGGDLKKFSDDSKLSRFIHLVCSDDADRDLRFSGAKQLKAYLKSSENTKNVSREAVDILEVLYGVLCERNCSQDVKYEVAICISAVGNTLCQENPKKYVLWLFSRLKTANVDDAKLLLLYAFLQSLKCNEKNKCLEECMTLVMDNVQAVLENADLPELLIAVVDIILYISQVYPSVFGHHFTNIVDILIGWHIDLTQKESLIRYTSDALVAFHQFWVINIDFSLMLLGQFLEDIEAYADDLTAGISNGSNSYDERRLLPDECLIKIIALIGVFTTVTKSVGDFLTQEPRSLTTTQYFLETICCILKCVESTTICIYSEKLLSAVNDCLHVLLCVADVEVIKISDIVLDFIINQVTGWRRSSTYLYLQSLLVLIIKVIDLINVHLPVNFITRLLLKDSELLQIRLSQNKQLLASCLTIYHTMLSLRNVPLLEEAYRHILGELTVSFNILLETVGEDHRCNLVQTNPYSGIMITPKLAELIIAFDICATAEVANAKHNLIGMWALSPNIFDLFIQHLLPCSERIMRHFPAIYYTVLQALYSHCSRHGHFISSSSLIISSPILDGTTGSINATTGSHFAEILTYLTNLLKKRILAHDNRVLLVMWIQEIVECLRNSARLYESFAVANLIQALITLGFCCNDDIATSITTSIQVYLTNCANRSDFLLKQCYDLCMLRLGDSSPDIKKAFLKVLMLLPLDITLRRTLYAPLNGQCDMKSLASVTFNERTSIENVVKRNIVTKTSVGTFQAQIFQDVMSFVFNYIPPSDLYDCNAEWLQRIFHNCQRLEVDIDKHEEAVLLQQLTDSYEPMLWFWCMWEASQFCILSKLRTPLGKPIETLTTIDAAIKDLVSQISRRSESNNASSLPDIGIGVCESRLNEKDSQENNELLHQEEIMSTFCGNLLHASLLLLFMEHLEKLMYNAYEGCAVALTPLPMGVRIFFRTNRATCLDWLSRVRQHLMTIGSHCKKPALVVRHAFELLREMKESNNIENAEFDRLVMIAVEALSDLKSSQAILGVYVWYRELLGKKLPWIKAMAEKASDRHENACSDLQDVLPSLMTTSNAIFSDDNLLGDNGTSYGKTPLLVNLRETVCDSPVITDGFQSTLTTLSQQHIFNGSNSSGLSLNTISDPVVTNFVLTQVCDSYVKLHSWDDVLKWQDTLRRYRNEHADVMQPTDPSQCDGCVKSLWRLSCGDLSFFRSHFNFESVNDCEACRLMQQPDTDSTPFTSPQFIEFARKQFYRCVAMIANAETWSSNIARSVNNVLEKCSALCESFLLTDALEPTLCRSTAILQLCAADAVNKLVNGNNSKNSMLSFSEDLTFEPEMHDLSLCLEAIQPTDLQEELCRMHGFDTAANYRILASRLRIQTARLARKQENTVLARRLLMDDLNHVNSVSLPEMTNSNIKEDDVMVPLQSRLAYIQTLFHNSQSTVCTGQCRLLFIQWEVSKLCHKVDCCSGIETLLSSVAGHLTNNDTIDAPKSIYCSNQNNVNCLKLEFKNILALSLVTLSKWLQSEQKYLSSLAAQLKMIDKHNREAKKKKVPTATLR